MTKIQELEEEIKALRVERGTETDPEKRRKLFRRMHLARWKLARVPRPKVEEPWCCLLLPKVPTKKSPTGGGRGGRS